MKTSSVVASVLFGSFALAAPLAAPLDKRTYVTKTETVVETVVVYTTVWDGEVPEATPTPALFYEHHPDPKTSPTIVAAAPTVKKVQPVVPTTTSSTVSAPAYTPPPAPVKPKDPPKPAPVEKKPPPPPPSSPSGSGQTYTGSYTMNYYGGGLGACGEPVNDGDMAVALGVELFKDATVDYMTGKTTNPWCGKKIEITNGGQKAYAKIMDRCPGCTGAGLDATPALWKATTGGLGGASGDRIYSMSWKVVG